MMSVTVITRRNRFKKKLEELTKDCKYKHKKAYPFWVGSYDVWEANDSSIPLKDYIKFLVEEKGLKNNNVFVLIKGEGIGVFERDNDSGFCILVNDIKGSRNKNVLTVHFYRRVNVKAERLVIQKRHTFEDLKELTDLFIDYHLHEAVDRKKKKVVEDLEYISRVGKLEKFLKDNQRLELKNNKDLILYRDEKPIKARRIRKSKINEDFLWFEMAIRLINSL